MQTTHCNTLQHTPTHCDTLQHTATVSGHARLYASCYTCQTEGSVRNADNTLQHTATHCNSLQHTATCQTEGSVRSADNTLQHPATHCNTLQHVKQRVAYGMQTTHCNTLQHTATHCNTLQHVKQRVAYGMQTALLCKQWFKTGKSLSAVRAGVYTQRFFEFKQGSFVTCRWWLKCTADSTGSEAQMKRGARHLCNLNHTLC